MNNWLIQKQVFVLKISLENSDTPGFPSRIILLLLLLLITILTIITAITITILIVVIAFVSVSILILILILPSSFAPTPNNTSVGITSVHILLD